MRSTVKLARKRITRNVIVSRLATLPPAAQEVKRPHNLRCIFAVRHPFQDHSSSLQPRILRERTYCRCGLKSRAACNEPIPVLGPHTELLPCPSLVAEFQSDTSCVQPRVGALNQCSLTSDERSDDFLQLRAGAARGEGGVLTMR